MGFNTFPCNPYPISTEELNKGNNDDLNAKVATLEGDVSDLNSNKANQITIAPFFNAETAYTAGDLVYYNGLSYRCTNDHEGAWDADDFAVTTIANELDALKNGLMNNTISPLTAGENVTIADGGYTMIGKLVIVNVRIDVTSAISGGAILLKGLPKPNNTSHYNTVLATVSNVNTYINAIIKVDPAGDLQVNTEVPAGVKYVHAVYVTN